MDGNGCSCFLWRQAGVEDDIPDQAVAAHRFAAGLDPALRHQLLDVADAQREPEIPAYRQQDHRRREPVTLEIDWGFTLLPALTT